MTALAGATGSSDYRCDGCGYGASMLPGVCPMCGSDAWMHGERLLLRRRDDGIVVIGALGRLDAPTLGLLMGAVAGLAQERADVLIALRDGADHRP